MVPLGMTSAGETGSIQKITGRDEVRRRLAELGFVVGAKVTVVGRPGGSVILSVGDGRVALDQSMAMRVLVSIPEGGLQ